MMLLLLLLLLFCEFCEFWGGARLSKGEKDGYGTSGISSNRISFERSSDIVRSSMSLLGKKNLDSCSGESVKPEKNGGATGYWKRSSIGLKPV